MNTFPTIAIAPTTFGLPASSRSGSPAHCTNKEKYLPAGTEASLATGLDEAIKPFVDAVSNAVTAIPGLPLLSGLAGLLGSGVTVTLTGLDTTPHPRTRAAQLRPIVALGFPKSPLAS